MMQTPALSRLPKGWVYIDARWAKEFRLSLNQAQLQFQEMQLFVSQHGHNLERDAQLLEMQEDVDHLTKLVSMLEYEGEAMLLPAKHPYYTGLVSETLARRTA